MNLFKKDSLGGNSQTVLIATVNPTEKYFGETLRTLQFAQRAKKVKNKAVINMDSSGKVAELQAELMKLRQKLMQYEAQIRTMSESGNNTRVRSHHRDLAFNNPSSDTPLIDEEKLKLEEINKSLWIRIKEMTLLIEKKEKAILVDFCFLFL